MKVGFILDSDIDFPGGVQRFVKGLYQYLVDSGEEAVIFTGGEVGKTEAEGFRVRRLGRIQRLPGNDTEVTVFADWLDCQQIDTLIKGEEIDVLHLQGMFGLLGARFLDCSEIPVLGTFHNFWETERLPGFVKLAFPLLRGYVEKLDERVADSPTARTLISRIAPGDYQIVPPGIKVSFFADAEPRRVFPKNVLEVLYVGRLDERKGLPYLLRALKQVQEDSLDVALVVIGKGPLRDEAECYVREEGLRNIRFLGFVSDEDLASHYCGADIFCSPAVHGECFGIVLAEAMAAGLPVVAFDNQGYRNVLTGAGEEFLVPSGDVLALTGVLERLVRNESLRQKMSRWSTNEVAQYDWSVVGDRYLGIFRRLSLRESV